MRTSESVKEISAALIKAQGSMGSAKKDTTNPFFKSRYADLASVFDAVRLPFLEAGIAIVQDVTCDIAQAGGGGWVGVTTRLQHVSGEWMEFGPLSVVLSKLDAQAVGSATSYGKRYSLSAATGVVADDDDDGEAAQARDKPESGYDRLKKAPQAKQEPAGATQGDPAALSLADQVQFAADSLSTIRNGMPSRALIGDASRFTGEDGKVKSFEDPKRVKSEAWLKKTLGNLEKWLHDAKMGSGPGADEGAEWLSDGPVSGGQKDGFPGD